jgi:HK97 family phage prohead protease
MYKRETRRASGPCDLCVERRASQGGGKVKTIRGYALKYGYPSLPLGQPRGPTFIETIRVGAARYGLDKGTDTRALIDHEPHLIIGRRSAGTLRMKDDKVGLRVEIDPPDTYIGQAIVESIRRRDVTGMSFAFTTIEDAWPSKNRRELISIDVDDVCPVTWPAYPDTTVGLRGARSNRLAELRLRLALALSK